MRRCVCVSRAPVSRLFLFVSCTLATAACAPSGDLTSGVIEARRVVVASESAGRVLAVAVDEGQRVLAGQLLLEIDCAMPATQRAAAQAQLAQSEAMAAQVAAQVQLVDEGPRAEEITAARADRDAAREALAMARRGATDGQRDQLEASIRAIEARSALAEANRARAEQLVDDGATPRAQLDTARAEADAVAAELERARAALQDAVDGARSEEVRIAERRLDQAQARLDALEAGAREPERRAAAAQLTMATAAADAARAALQAAELQVERCSVRAPVDAQVDIVAIEVGELVGPGSPLVALGASGPLTLTSWATPAALATLAVGDRVPLLIEAPGATPIEARVMRIGDEAEFTASNVQTPDDRALLVFEVELELPEGTPGARPGATATVDFAAAQRGAPPAAATPGSGQ